MKTTVILVGSALLYWLVLPYLLNTVGLHAMAHYLQWWIK